MAAVCELEPHDGVAGLEQRVEDGGVRLRARVRLHVDVVAAEQRERAVDGQLLGDVDVLAAAVVTLPGYPSAYLLVSTEPWHSRTARGAKFLGGDHLQRLLLARELRAQRCGDRGSISSRGAFSVSSVWIMALSSRSRVDGLCGRRSDDGGGALQAQVQRRNAAILGGGVEQPFGKVLGE
jgi:hypothetical protein